MSTATPGTGAPPAPSLTPSQARDVGLSAALVALRARAGITWRVAAKGATPELEVPDGQVDRAIALLTLETLGRIALALEQRQESGFTTSDSDGNLTGLYLGPAAIVNKAVQKGATDKLQGAVNLLTSHGLKVTRPGELEGPAGDLAAPPEEPEVHPPMPAWAQVLDFPWGSRGPAGNLNDLERAATAARARVESGAIDAEAKAIGLRNVARALEEGWGALQDAAEDEETRGRRREASRA